MLLLEGSWLVLRRFILVYSCAYGNIMNSHKNQSDCASLAQRSHEDDKNKSHSNSSTISSCRPIDNCPVEGFVINNDVFYADKPYRLCA